MNTKPFRLVKPAVRVELEKKARELGYKPTEDDRDADLRAIISERKAA